MPNTKKTRTQKGRFDCIAIDSGIDREIKRNVTEKEVFKFQKKYMNYKHSCDLILVQDHNGHDVLRFKKAWIQEPVTTCGES